MEFLANFALFAAKTIFIAAAIVIVAAFLFQIGSGRKGPKAAIEIEKLNKRLRSYRRQLRSQLLKKKDFKRFAKEEKKNLKAADKTQASETPEKRVFVVDFIGDIRATATDSLREEITAILTVAKPGDEAVVRLESGGGLVTSYGLAASQLARLKEQNIRLTICVDKVAASGGYMMACVADRIVAAPFAILGSIGVIAQVPNFNKILKKHDVDYREVTAGEFKRTVTVFGEITEPGMRKFKEQIEGTHQLFKLFISQHRPQVDLARAATGEYWYATQAKEFGLVDDILTSDDYLARLVSADDGGTAPTDAGAEVFRVRFQGKKSLMERLTDSGSQVLQQTWLRLWTDLDRSRFDV